MILNYDFKENSKLYSDYKLKDLKLELANLQLNCHLKGIPVIIIIDGWESSGKGYIINEISQRLDTKNYSVGIFSHQDRGDYLFTRDFWFQLPAWGDFAIFDRSKYSELIWALDADEDLIDRKLAYMLKAEDMVLDDGTIILKFFIHTTKKQQRKRIEELAYDRYRDFLVNRADVYQNLYFNRFKSRINTILTKSNSQRAKWHIINGLDLKEATKTVLVKSIEAISDKLEQLESSQPTRVERDYHSKKILDKIPTNLVLSRKSYNQIIEPLQREAADLAYKLYKRDIPSIMVLEGVDAAGKGGSIRRLTRYMDPRGYQVNPTAAPSGAEKDHHYLWRFYNNLPKAGNMAIFDRSWYGRLMVERVEKLTPVEDWSRAYDEINAMEKELVESGALLIKYFISIDKDEQLARFKDRAINKPHKLTDEDWRNRESWDENIIAMDEMLDRTSTDYAPWDIVPSNSKEYGRVEVLKIFIERAKDILSL